MTPVRGTTTCRGNMNWEKPVKLEWVLSGKEYKLTREGASAEEKGRVTILGGKFAKNPPYQEGRKKSKIYSSSPKRDIAGREVCNNLLTGHRI